MNIFSRFIENYSGNTWFSVVSFLLCFSVFVAVVIYIAKIDKIHSRRMKNYPLDPDHNIEEDKIQ